MHQSVNQIVLHFAAMSLCLFSIWHNDFLPMQDYPLHLFIAKALESFNDPESNWSENYILNPVITPYSLLHHTIAFLSEYVSIQSAGKIIVSVYVLLVTYISLSFRPNTPHATESSWPSILLFPVIFNQTYYLGFINFLISIPILILALQQHDLIANNRSLFRNTITHITTLALLFIIHPYTAAIFITSALLLQLKNYIQKAKNTYYSPIPIIYLVIFILWISSNLSPDNLYGGEHKTLSWISPPYTILFHILSFTNSAPANISLFIPTIFWSIIVVTIIPVMAKNANLLLKSSFFLLFIATSIGLYVLPFAVGDYHYFNLRLAPISIFFLVLSLSIISFSSQRKAILAVCSMGLLLHSSYIHYMVSSEKAMLTPILANMRPNASLLPLYLDSTSSHINNFVYYEFDDHDHNYYHILVGGGVSPNILPNHMFPLLSRNAKSRHSVELLSYASWKRAAPSYTYLLIRHGGKQLSDLPSQFRSVVRNEMWELFINTQTQ